MGRPAKEGWSLRWRRGGPGKGVGHVRFTFAGKDHVYSTGERDPGAAREKAAAIYTRVISGRQVAVIGTDKEHRLAPLVDLIAFWLADVESELDPETIKTYTQYSRRWLDHFQTLERFVAPRALADFKNVRLSQVTASSVRKELSAMRGFFRWCSSDAQGILASEPIIPSIKKRAVGTRASTRLPAPEVSAGQAIAFLRHLPEFGGKGKNVFPVRTRFVVQWETTLRPATLAALEAGVHYRRGSAELQVPNGDDKARLGRAIPLTPAARAALDAVCPDVGLIFGKHDYRTHIHRARDAAKMPAGFVAYALRHARITNFLEETGNLPAAQYMAGHKHATTTNKYVRPSKRAAETMLRQIVGADYDTYAPASVSGPILDPDDEEAVRRRGLEPLRELPHWNLKADGVDLSIGDDSVHVSQVDAENASLEQGCRTEVQNDPVARAAVYVRLLKAQADAFDMLLAEEFDLAAEGA